MNNLSEKEKQVISYLYDEFKKGNKKFEEYLNDNKDYDKILRGSSDKYLCKTKSIKKLF